MSNKKRFYESDFLTKNEFLNSQKKFQFEIESLIQALSKIELMGERSSELQTTKELLLLLKGDTEAIIRLSGKDWKRYLSYYFQFVNQDFKHQAIKHVLREYENKKI